jgi:putative ABC transport system permease protein
MRARSKPPSNKSFRYFDNGTTFAPVVTTISPCARNRKSPMLPPRHRGIMNIMLVSVTERTREIGVRMAVGAHGNDILTQFLIEAVTLSSVGGVIGIICGIATSRILSIYANWPTLISISSIAIAFLFSAAVGVFFGFYPARKAAALDPIEALRYE